MIATVMPCFQVVDFKGIYQFLMRCNYQKTDVPHRSGAFGFKGVQ
jgi:hypothetical protein